MISFFKERRMGEHFQEEMASERYTVIVTNRSSCDDEILNAMSKIDTPNSLILLEKARSMLFSFKKRR